MADGRIVHDLYGDASNIGAKMKIPTYSLTLNPTVGQRGSIVFNTDDNTLRESDGLSWVSAITNSPVGGVLTGSLPNPQLANGSVTSAKLATTGVVAGTVGDATHVAQITVNPQGQITSMTPVSISGGGSFDPANPVFYGTGTAAANSGAGSTTIGPQASTLGGASAAAFGLQAHAGAANSLALGNLAITGGQLALAAGQNVQANGTYGIAIGQNFINPLAQTVMIGCNGTPTIRALDPQSGTLFYHIVQTAIIPFSGTTANVAVSDLIRGTVFLSNAGNITVSLTPNATGTLFDSNSALQPVSLGQTFTTRLVPSAGGTITSIVASAGVTVYGALNPVASRIVIATFSRTGTNTWDLYFS